MYKKEYNQVFESKDEDWREKHNYKDMKYLDYRSDKAKKVDKASKEDECNAEETDQELLPWIESKDKFNKLKNRILSLKDDKLKTGTDKYRYDFSNRKEVIIEIANNKIKKSNPIDSLKEDSTDILEIKK